MTPKPRPVAAAATSRRRRAVLVVAAVALVGAGAPAVASQAAEGPAAAPAPVGTVSVAPASTTDGDRLACATHAEGPTTPGQLAAEQAGLGTVRRVSCLAHWRLGTRVSAQAQAQARAQAQALIEAQAQSHARAVAPAGSKTSKSSKSKTKSPTPDPGSGGVVLPRLGVRPSGIADIYQLDQTRGAGTTVGVVVAFDDPVVESDLAVYRAAFGLPACTSANGCFRKLNQRGTTTPPKADSGWSVEISLDVQAVSASCPLCKIVLVEADSDDLDDIAAAAKVAGGLADVVSHSYGLPEFKGLTTYASKYYSTPGVPDVVASGDHGYGDALFPSVLPDVIAVGGTKVVKKKGGWVHSAWTGAGSACSTLVAQPSWQTPRSCSMRAVSDISALADTQTGLAVYDTYLDANSAGWIVVGGTSLAAPLVAGMVALSGDEKNLETPAKFYAATSGLLDVVKGSNGSCPSPLCKAKAGWDGPTGLGTPQGLSAF